MTTSGPQPTAPSVMQKVRIPVIVATTDTSERQEKGGIEISVVPVTYAAKVQTRTTYEQTELPPFVWDIPANSIFVLETTTHSLRIEPERLQFLVKINNKLSRSFRGAGTVVQFNVDGKLRAVDQLGYVDLLNVIVPPRTEAQVAISGPPLDNLPDQAPVALMLYDVVTATDAAGNVTEKQNFEWIYQCTVKETEQSVPSTTRVKKWIPVQQFQQSKMHEQMQKLPQGATGAPTTR